MTRWVSFDAAEQIGHYWDAHAHDLNRTTQREAVAAWAPRDYAGGLVLNSRLMVADFSAGAALAVAMYLIGWSPIRRQRRSTK
jgi:hypothetical protein